MFEKIVLETKHLVAIKKMLGLSSTEFKNVTGINFTNEATKVKKKGSEPLQPSVALFLRFFLEAEKHIKIDDYPSAEEIYEILKKGNPDLTYQAFSLLMGADRTAALRWVNTHTTPRRSGLRYFYYIRELSHILSPKELYEMVEKAARDEAEARGLPIFDMSSAHATWHADPEELHQKKEQLQNIRPRGRRGSAKNHAEKMAEERKQLEITIKKYSRNWDRPFVEGRFNAPVETLPLNTPLQRFCNEFNIRRAGDLLELPHKKLLLVNGVQKVRLNKFISQLKEMGINWKTKPKRQN